MTMAGGSNKLCRDRHVPRDKHLHKRIRRRKKVKKEKEIEGTTRIFRTGSGRTGEVMRVAVLSSSHQTFVPRVCDDDKEMREKDYRSRACPLGHRHRDANVLVGQTDRWTDRRIIISQPVGQANRPRTK